MARKACKSAWFNGDLPDAHLALRKVVQPLLAEREARQRFRRASSGCESGPRLRAAVHGVRTFDGLDCGCLIPLALAVQQIVLMLLERTFGGSPKARPPWR